MGAHRAKVSRVVAGTYSSIIKTTSQWNRRAEESTGLKVGDWDKV
jgi:hypothetical protein